MFYAQKMRYKNYIIESKAGVHKVKEENGILNHELVPHQKILSDADLKKLCTQLNITKNQLPQMYDNDPIVELLGAKVGDVIKIKRSSQTAGQTDYYRLVVSPPIK